MSVFIVNIWSLLLMKQSAELFRNVLSTYFYLYFNILFIWDALKSRTVGPTGLVGLHKLCHPTIQDGSTWSKFGARGEYGDVFLFPNLGAL